MDLLTSSVFWEAFWCESPSCAHPSRSFHPDTEQLRNVSLGTFHMVEEFGVDFGSSMTFGCPSVPWQFMPQFDIVSKKPVDFPQSLSVKQARRLSVNHSLAYSLKPMIRSEDLHEVRYLFVDSFRVVLTACSVRFREYGAVAKKELCFSQEQRLFARTRVFHEQFAISLRKHLVCGSLA